MNAKEKMIKYGAGALSPADLISVVIGGRNADTVAENIAEYIGDNIRDSVNAIPKSSPGNFIEPIKKGGAE